MGNRTIGVAGTSKQWDGVQEALVTMVAVCMGVEETGMQTRHKGALQSPPSWGRDQGWHADTAEQLRSISMPIR